MTTIHEHTVDLSLLPKKANILDLGCRGFEFSDYFIQLGHNVHSVDCDLLKTFGRDYHWLAITSHNGQVGIERFNDIQATRIRDGGNEVNAMTLSAFSENVDVNWWDLIKMDIEGAEYQIIMSLDKPPAKQLSIEFHLHTAIYGTHEIEKMEFKLISLGYDIIQHKMEPRHGLRSNFWDSLFVFSDK